MIFDSYLQESHIDYFQLKLLGIRNSLTHLKTPSKMVMNPFISAEYDDLPQSHAIEDHL